MNGSLPVDSKKLFAAGLATPPINNSRRRATTAGGVFAGAYAANQ